VQVVGLLDGVGLSIVEKWEERDGHAFSSLLVTAPLNPTFLGGLLSSVFPKFMQQFS
jgi:hypothetical protein